MGTIPQNAAAVAVRSGRACWRQWRVAVPLVVVGGWLVVCIMHNAACVDDTSSPTRFLEARTTHMTVICASLYWLFQTIVLS